MLGIMAGILVIPAHAQTTSEFGYQLHPEKLLENTEGTLQIFVTSNEMMVPKEIEGLKAISSDNSIIEIIGVNEGNDRFTKNITIKAKNPGISGIVLAAPGFSSKEISLEVFNNNNYPTQILMKITPDTFPIDGPKYGHVAVELATTGGLPTLALEDTIIHLNTPNTDTIKLKDTEVVIPSGEYYVLTEFEIIGSGDSIIFAETEGMTKISSIVTILEPPGPLTIILHAIPDVYNSYSGTSGIAVVQLVDSEGTPVLAEEDIHLKLNVENPVYSKKDTEIKLVSNNEQVLEIPQELTIKDGEYFTTFEIITHDEGQIELALLSEDFALTKYDINVVDISPELSLVLLGSMNWNERIEAKLSITIPEITTALDGFNVEWETEGGN